MGIGLEYYSYGRINPEKQQYVKDETARMRAKGWTSSECKLKYVVDKKASRKFGVW